MAEEGEEKDREKISKIEGLVCGQSLKREPDGACCAQAIL